MSATLRERIAAPIDIVFGIVADPECHRGWLHGIVETVPLDGPLDRRGATFIQRYEEFGERNEYRGTVTAHEPPRRHAILLDGPHFRVTLDYSLEPGDPGFSELKFFVRFHTRGSLLRHLLFPDMPWHQVRWVYREETQRIKALAESIYRSRVDAE